MKRYVYDHTGDVLLRVEEAIPICGEDFCDTCGDCLACFDGDPCYGGMEERSEHFWVVYELEAD